MEGSNSQLSSVRFGSLDYIQETLPSSQAAKLKSLVGGLKDSSVVSVLVKAPAEDLSSSLAENSILLRCLRACQFHTYNQRPQHGTAAHLTTT